MDYLTRNLRQIFLYDYSNLSKRMESIISLFDYYRDDDVTDELLEIYRRCQLYVSAQLNFTLLLDKAEPKRDFSCELRDCAKNMTQFTFSPTVNVNSYGDVLFEELNKINSLIENVEVDKLVYYIKKKAIAHGDFNLND